MVAFWFAAQDGGGAAGGEAVLGIGAIEVILQQPSQPMLAKSIQV